MPHLPDYEMTAWQPEPSSEAEPIWQSNAAFWFALILSTAVGLASALLLVNLGDFP